MKISDIQRGKSTILEIQQVSHDEFPLSIIPLQEVEFIVSDFESEVLLRIGDNSWEVEGVGKQHHELLQMVDRDLPKVSWVAAKRPRDKNASATSLVVEVREFPSEHTWHETVDLGVDDKVVEAMREKRKSLTAINDVVEWLNEYILVADPGGTTRILFSGSPDRQIEDQNGFRIYGKGWAVDIARDEEHRLIVKKVVESKKAKNNSERRPVMLARGQFRFVDYTIAGSFRGTAQSELDQIVGEAGSYLAIWQQYNELEHKNILDRARKFGWLSYHSKQLLADGRWQFFLSNDDQLERCMRFLEDNETVDLEASIRPPAELTATETGTASSEASENRRKRVFAGECVGYNRDRRTVDLRLPPWIDEEGNPPPEKGVLFMSLGGDRVRLERRQEAQSKISSAECPMPQLGLLIEGKTVPARRRKKERPLSAAAREAFGGEPTGRQIEALKVALNTPDIALIQGPPGTGKTRTIAALQVRLSEISESSDGISGRYLLTSYQHDAVENVANATQVFGLPAIKIGRKRGQEDEVDGFERWRQDRVEAVRAKLAASDDLPASVALWKCRDLTIAYLQAPARTDDLSALLSEIRIMAVPHIPPLVSDHLLELEQKLRQSSHDTESNNPDVEQILKAVRGLRITNAAFSDDGDIQARKVFRRLQQMGVVLQKSEEELLEKAAEWDVELDPDFLSELEILQVKLIVVVLFIQPDFAQIKIR